MLEKGIYLSVWFSFVDHFSSQNLRSLLNFEKVLIWDKLLFNVRVNFSWARTSGMGSIIFWWGRTEWKLGRSSEFAPYRIIHLQGLLWNNFLIFPLKESLSSCSRDKSTSSALYYRLPSWVFSLSDFNEVTGAILWFTAGILKGSKLFFFLQKKNVFLGAKEFLTDFWLFCKNILPGMVRQSLIIGNNIADWLYRTIITMENQNIS